MYSYYERYEQDSCNKLLLITSQYNNLIFISLLKNTSLETYLNLFSAILVASKSAANHKKKNKMLVLIKLFLK